MLFPTSVFPQQELSISVSNVFRYGSSNEAVNPLYLQKEYVENMSDTRISYQNFLLGIRLLHDDPPESGIQFTGIRKRYMEFTKEDIVVRVGDSYTLFGRGLALNLFERRTLGFDTGLDGVKVTYANSVVKAIVTGGDVLYHDVLNESRIEEYQVRAGSLEIIPCPYLSIGFNYVGGKVRFPNTPLNEFAGRFDMPEYTTHFHVDDIDGYISFAEKRTEVYPTFINPLGDFARGTGAYGSVSYTQKSFGVSLEYKDYRFGIVNPVDRNVPDRVTKALAIQNPPIVHKEHSFTLLTRYPHVIDFGDEVGFQFDLFYSFSQLTGSLNVATASRHYSFVPTGETDRTPMNPIYRGESRENGFLPSLSEKFSPFREFYFDVQYFLEESCNDYAEIAFNWREDKTALEAVRLGSSPIIEIKRTASVPVAFQYTLSEGLVATFTSEQQWVRDDTNPVRSDFYNQLFSLSVSKSPIAALTIRYEFTTDEGTVDARKDWTVLDVSVRIGNSHTITLAVGGDRGGQVCSNGVCRIFLPFLGFRTSITSYF